MSGFDTPIQAPSELITEGLHWAQEQFVQEQSTASEEVLKACYFHGIKLYESHREKMLVEIEEAGGVNRINASDYRGSGSNHIQCVDGKIIYARRLLTMEPIELPLPEGEWGFDHTQQTYGVKVSFGAGGSRVSASEVEKADDRYFNDRHFLQKVLDGDFVPGSVGAAEYVTTTYENGKKTGIWYQDKEATVHGHLHEVAGRVWFAHLREEFAPDPATDPEAYAFWLRSKPIPILDIFFRATAKALQGKDRFGVAHFDDYGMQSYVDHGNYVPFTVEAAQKMVRFGQLLSLVWKKEFGTDMPMPTTNTGRIEAAEPLAITAQ